MKSVTQSATYKGRVRRLIPGLARRFFKKLLMKQVPRPNVILSDELREFVLKELREDHQKFFEVFGGPQMSWDRNSRSSL